MTRPFIAVWAICRYELSLWRHRPGQILGSMLLAAAYGGAVIAGAQATSREPAAVVNLDRGAVGAKLTQALVNADVLDITVTGPAQAARMYRQLQVAAVITIPHGLTWRAHHHQMSHVNVLANNLNADLEGDIRRAVPDAIVNYYQGLGGASPMRVVITDQQMLHRQIQLYQYSALPIIILVTTVAGIMSSGLAVASEYQRRTIKSVLLAPVSRLAVITGKMAAGFLSTFGIAVAALAASAALGLARPEGGPRFWAAALAAIALTALFGAGLGLAVGVFWQRKQPVNVAATILAVQLFALSGGVGVIWFEPQLWQRIAMYDPLTYGIHSLQQASFYASTAQFARDAAVLAAASALTAVAGSLAMRRRLITQ